MIDNNDEEFPNQTLGFKLQMNQFADDIKKSIITHIGQITKLRHHGGYTMLRSIMRGLVTDKLNKAQRVMVQIGQYRYVVEVQPAYQSFTKRTANNHKTIKLIKEQYLEKISKKFYAAIDTVGVACTCLREAEIGNINLEPAYQLIYLLGQKNVDQGTVLNDIRYGMLRIKLADHFFHEPS